MACVLSGLRPDTAVPIGETGAEAFPAAVRAGCFLSEWRGEMPVPATVIRTAAGVSPRRGGSSMIKSFLCGCTSEHPHIKYTKTVYTHPAGLSNPARHRQVRREAGAVGFRAECLRIVGFGRFRRIFASFGHFARGVRVAAASEKTCGLRSAMVYCR